MKAYLNIFRKLYKEINRSLKDRVITIAIAWAVVKKQTNLLEYISLFLNIFKPLILIFKITLFLDFIFIVFSEFYKNFILCISVSYESFSMKRILEKW